MTADLQIADLALDERSHVIEVEGQVDLYSAPELKARMLQVVDDGTTGLVVDLSRVGFMDSTGLSVLVGVRNRLARADGMLAIVIRDDLAKLFEITGLTGTFEIHRSRDGAIASLTAAQRSA